MMRKVIHKTAFFFVVLLLGAQNLIQAAHLVTFTKGQAIVVQSAEKRGNWYYFVLDGGGEMGVPVNRVSRIEDYEAPPSPVAPSAAPVAGGGQPPSVVPSSQPSPDPATTAQAPAAMAPADPQAQNGTSQPEAANVMSRGEDWRYRVKMSGGPRPQLQQDNPGGIRRMPGARGGPGRIQGYLGQPGGRRPPGAASQQQNNPPQQ